MSASIRIIFNSLDLALYPVLVPLEINHTVVLLVPTTDMTSGDATVVITATGFLFLFYQSRPWRSVMQVIMLYLNDSATAWRCGFCLNNCHDY